jgi:hypothetical protein
MRLNAAGGRTQRMLDVQHLVEEHVLHSEAGHDRAVEPAIHHDLIERGIKAAKLGAPCAAAPTESRSVKPSAEVEPVEPREHGREIEVRAPGAGLDATPASAAQRGNTTASARRDRVVAVSREELTRSTAPVDPREQDSGRSLKNHQGRAAQYVRNPHARALLLNANGVHQIRIRIKLDSEPRRAARASQARVDALKEPRTARDV